MYLNTVSKDEMKKSIRDLFKLDINKVLYEFNKMEEDEFSDFIDKNVDIKNLDEILFFHLARRLNDLQEDTCGKNLMELLTTQNTFTEFLKKYGLIFFECEGKIELEYNGRLINWDLLIYGNVQYMKNRLGYNKIQDYCFNGFAIGDNLLKNSYARYLSFGPELIQNLSECLMLKSLQTDFINNSKYYYYEYKFPFEKVVFDRYENLSIDDKKKKLIYYVIEYISESMSDSNYEENEHSNPMLRLMDNDLADSKYFLEKVEIDL